MGMITTAEVAARLGVHRSRVNDLMKEGRLPAQRFGKVYLVDEKDLRLVAKRKPGRPAKPTSKKRARSEPQR